MAAPTQPAGQHSTGQDPSSWARVWEVDDTSSCPVARCCEACEAVDDVLVVTAAAPTGVLCVTLCLDCVAAADVPRLSLVEVCSRVLLHCCAHVGIDPEDLTAFGAIPGVPNASARGDW